MGPLLPFLGLAACAAVGTFAAVFALVALMAWALDLAQGTLDLWGSLADALWVGLLGIIAFFCFLGVRACRRRFKRARGPAVPVAGRLPAPVGRRMRAVGMDSLLLLPVLGLTHFLPAASLGAFAALNLSYFLLQVYCVAMLAWRGQTLGKRALKVRVVRLDGSPVGTYAVLLRTSIDLAWTVLFMVQSLLAWRRLDSDALRGMSYHDLEHALDRIPPAQIVLLAAVFLWYGADYLSMLFTARRRALHDLLGGTVVVSMESRMAKAPAQSDGSQEIGAPSKGPLQGSIP